MAHTVRDWMSSPVIVILPETNVSQAMTLMRRRGIRSLVIDLTKGEDKAYGIVTTTDIRDKIVGDARNPAEVAVSEIMTSPVVSANPEWSLREAAIKMREVGSHHLPVEDERGTLLGMISATDIFFAVEESGWETDL